MLKNQASIKCGYTGFLFEQKKHLKFLFVSCPGSNHIGMCLLSELD